MRNRSRLFILGWLAIGGMAVLLLGFGIAAYAFTQYGNRAGASVSEQPAPQIYIDHPMPGNQFARGTFVYINTWANSPDPILSTELWVDGIRAGVHVGPENGASPFSSEFTWIPEQPGSHLLVARAIDSRNNIASSNSVQVIITSADFDDTAENGEAAELVAAGEAAPENGEKVEGSSSPIVFPSAGSDVAAPAPPTPGTSVGSAESWQGSIGNWVTSLTAQEAPNAPQLVAAPNGCGATLTIHDKSSNEEGFSVKRQMPNGSIWHLIETLNSQSDSEWITYSDTGVSGLLTYSVTAFNRQGESISNLVLVDVEASDCLAAEQDDSPLTVLTVELLSLTADQPLGQAYCYNSLNGAYWTRWPETGFFAQSEVGLIRANHREQIVLNSIDGERTVQSLNLQLECWHWQDGALHLLGEMSRSIDPQTPEIIRADIGEVEVEIEVHFTDSHDLGMGILDLDDGSGIQAPSDPNPGQVPLEPLAETLLSHLQMPFVTAWISYDPAFCGGHLEPEAQNNPFAPTIFCQPFPGYNIGPGGANPQAYLVWLIQGTSCPGAQFDMECVTLGGWMNYAWVKNATLSFRVNDYTSKIPIVYVDPIRSVYVVPPPQTSCLGPRNFRVSLHFEFPGGLFKLVGPTSNEVTMPCKPPSGDTVSIEVNFQTLHLSNVDDCCGDEVLEVRTRRMWANAISGDSIKLTDVECFKPYVNPEAGTLGCGGHMTNGIYPISGFYLCRTLSYAKQNVCLYPDYYTVDPSHLYNNIAVLTVREGDAIDLGVSMWDYDAAIIDGNDVVCNTNVWTPAKSLAQWAATTNESYQLAANHDNADCKVDVVINAVPSQ